MLKLPARLLLSFCCACACIPAAMAQDRVTDQELAEEYNYEKAAMEQKSEYLLSQIVASSKERALAAVARIQAGEAFGDVADSMSIDPAAKRNGGDMGWVDIDILNDEAGAAIRKLAKGRAMDAPIKTSLGWHVILLRDVRPLEYASFASMKEKLSKAMQDRYNEIHGISPYRMSELAEMFYTFPSGPPIVRRLLAGKPKLDLPGKQGFTPLTIACASGSLANVQLLLAAKANPDRADKFGLTPLETCLNNRHDGEKTAGALLDAGAKVDLFDGHGHSALSYEAHFKRADAVAFLLARGAPVELGGKDGATPLMVAASVDAGDVVEKLLAFGADPLARMHGADGAEFAPVTLAYNGAAGVNGAKQPKPNSTLPMLRDAAAAVVRKQSARGIEAYIVQGSTRQLMDGRTITLKRAPFAIEVALTHGKELMVHASTGDELVRALGQPGIWSDFGDAYHAVNPAANPAANGDGSAFNGLVVSDTRLLTYQNWVLGDGGGKGTRSIQFLDVSRLSDFADSARSGRIRVAELGRPLYLIAAVGESIGAPLVVTTQYRWIRIQWR